jgi:hypothetical protein
MGSPGPAVAPLNGQPRKVLAGGPENAGFVLTGSADPAGPGGKPGTWYQRDLAAGDR